MTSKNTGNTSSYNEAQDRYFEAHECEIASVFACCICVGTLVDPVMMNPCQHMYCRQCYVNAYDCEAARSRKGRGGCGGGGAAGGGWFRFFAAEVEKKDKCALCRSVEIESISPPQRAVLNALGALEGRCSVDGCQWRGTHRVFHEVHVKEKCTIIGDDEEARKCKEEAAESLRIAHSERANIIASQKKGVMEAKKQAEDRAFLKDLLGPNYQPPTTVRLCQCLGARHGYHKPLCPRLGAGVNPAK